MTWHASMAASVLFILSSSVLAAEPETVQGKLLADSARWHVDNPTALRSEGGTPVVQHILEAAGFPHLEPIGPEALWMGSFGRRHYNDQPHVGDLVFFSRATEPADERLVPTRRVTDVGVVTDVDDRGHITYVVAHERRFAAVTGWMNLGEREHVEHFHGFLTLDADWFPTRDEPMPVLTDQHLGSHEPRTADSPIRTALDGDELTHEHLAGSSCRTLWAVRNTVLARHGYTFDSRAARVFFSSRRWYEADPAVDARTIDDWLTPLDRINLDLVEDTEYRAGCKDVALR